MNAPGEFEQILINAAPVILIILCIGYIALVLGIRSFPASNDVRYGKEMQIRSAVNWIFFALAVVYLFEGMRIGNVGTMLMELNTNFIDGGPAPTPLYDASELVTIKSLSSGALYSSFASFVLCLIGFALQIWRMRRYRATNPPQAQSA